MRLAVLGATGRTGVEVVGQALLRGHEVRALVRDADKASAVLPGSEELTLFRGDLTDATAVARAVDGAEAVIDVSGPVKGSPEDLRRQVSRALVPAMQRHGVKRLVWLTGAGVRQPGDTPKLPDRAIRGVMSLLQRELLEDGEAAVRTLQAADLQVTIVRVPRLVDAAARGGVTTVARVGGGHGVTLGRADLAAFLLDEAEQAAWVGRAPVVSW